jgi:hypothetical protein
MQTPTFSSSNRRILTFWDYCDNFPPILCRLLARHRYNRPMTTDEIAKQSGCLSAAEVEAISKATDWKPIKVVEMQAFLRGCKLDFCDPSAMRRVRDYLTKFPTFQYLRKSPQWKSYYMPLLLRWIQNYGIVTTDSPIWPPLRALLIRMIPVLEMEAKRNTP